MTPEQFTYWLQGFFEISNTNSLNENQVLIIKDHLKLVFNKVTPNRTENYGTCGSSGKPIIGSLVNNVPLYHNLTCSFNDNTKSEVNHDKIIEEKLNNKQDPKITVITGFRK